MATAGKMGKTICTICNEQRITYFCKGCSKEYCFSDLTKHRVILSEQFDILAHDFNRFREKLINEKEDSEQRVLIQQVNRWEEVSIEKIKKTAQECRRILLEHTDENIMKTEKKLNRLMDDLEPLRQKDEWYETDLANLKEKLQSMKQELAAPQNISIQQDSGTFIKNISVSISPGTQVTVRWASNGVTIAGGHGSGHALNQLYLPLGLHINDDDTIFIADFANDRIVKWKIGDNIGEVIIGSHGRGKQMNQLDRPFDVIFDNETDSLIISDGDNRRVMRWLLRNDTMYGEIILDNIDCYGLAIDDQRYIYVSDIEKNEVRRYRVGDINSKLVAGGNGQGMRLNQLNRPTYVFVDQDHSVYVSDRDNHRVIKWAKDANEGILVAGGRGYGNGLGQLSYPRGVIVDSLGTVYVADEENHRVMRWHKGAIQGDVLFGGNGKGQGPNQLHWPHGLSVDRHQHFYVVDYGNDRVQRYSIEANMENVTLPFLSIK
ncbi:unnamed protein product [Rotaria socialis]|uniref:Uncharacterized protein n=1 Tax=Rotaria socialis TaxID=392032 RepID=A0A820EQP9_9BILA|nr:unnamed protein product [Rotaria socialis]CAF4252398.1 unnamed protein product [Rotaria socialis]